MYCVQRCPMLKKTSWLDFRRSSYTRSTILCFLVTVGIGYRLGELRWVMDLLSLFYVEISHLNDRHEEHMQLKDYLKGIYSLDFSWKGTLHRCKSNSDLF